jgi:hypothetical protein
VRAPRKIRGAGEKTLRDAGSRATKAFYSALSLCDLILSGVFEGHPRLTLAIVELELAPNASDGGRPTCSRRWTTRAASAMARRFTASRPALAKAGDGMRPSDFFGRSIILSFQEDAIGIRLRDVIGPTP